VFATVAPRAAKFKTRALRPARVKFDTLGKGTLYCALRRGAHSLVRTPTHHYGPGSSVTSKTSEQTPEGESSGGGAGGSLGQQLRRAREALGVTLREVSEQTRITMRHLEAIEADEYKHLPGGIFNKSFIKSYARAVRFDEAARARTLRAHGARARRVDGRGCDHAATLARLHGRSGALADCHLRAERRHRRHSDSDRLRGPALLPAHRRTATRRAADADARRRSIAAARRRRPRPSFKASTFKLKPRAVLAHLLAGRREEEARAVPEARRARGVRARIGAQPALRPDLCRRATGDGQRPGAQASGRHDHLDYHEGQLQAVRSVDEVASYKFQVQS
jgi:hypothetical protein